MAGVRIEAIAVNRDQWPVSINNGAGVFYLEGLRQGAYRLEINGEPAQPNRMIIDTASEPFQELNLQR